MDKEYDRDEEIKKLDEKITYAQENFGDEEVRDAILNKAEFFNTINDKEKAIEVYKEAFKKTIGIGKKMDIIFSILLIYIAQKNLDKIQEHIAQQKKLLEDGGDWERKNRLKVYEGIYFLMIRDFKSTSNLFLDSIATFNSPEVITYNDLVYYTVLTSIISLPRSEVKKKIVHSPEILSTIREIPILKRFLDAYYKCDYKEFFLAFAEILQTLPQDKYLSSHRKYFTREMRIVIYSQFLESYKTVTLANMAQAFGVSVKFIDRELSELISGRRLNCKIDKVSGQVESERVDERNGLYKTALREGDHLLNRVQKLSRVIDV